MSLPIGAIRGLITSLNEKDIATRRVRCGMINRNHASNLHSWYRTVHCSTALCKDISHRAVKSRLTVERTLAFKSGFYYTYYMKKTVVKKSKSTIKVGSKRSIFKKNNYGIPMKQYTSENSKRVEVTP